MFPIPTASGAAAAAARAPHQTVAQKTTIGGRRPHSTFTFHKIFNSKNLRSLITLWVNSFKQSTMGEHVVIVAQNANFLKGHCEINLKNLASEDMDGPFLTSIKIYTGIHA